VIVTAARPCYEDELSQEQVTDRLGVSRSTVSRLGQLARGQVIVHIEVRPPSPPSQLRRGRARAAGWPILLGDRHEGGPAAARANRVSSS
jgi:hypothetical protein